MPRELLATQAPSDQGPDVVDGILYLGTRDEVICKGALVAYRLANALGFDETLVYSQCTVVHRSGVHAKDAPQVLDLRICEVAKRPYAHALEALCALLADAGHDADLHGCEKGCLAAWIHHRQPLWLVEIGGDFRDRLAARDADGAGDAQFGDMLLDARGDGHGVVAREASGRHVEKRLVNRDLLE